MIKLKPSRAGAARAVMLALASVLTVGTVALPAQAAPLPPQGIPTTDPSTLCPDGASTCVSDLLSQQQAYETSQYTPTPPLHGAIFATLYVDVTQGTYQTAVVNNPNYFEYPAWLFHNEYIFGKYYEWAHTHYQAGQKNMVTPAWNAVMDADYARTQTGSGNELSALVAHVMGDFPFVTWQAGVDEKYHNTYNQVNPILAAAEGPANAELAQRCDPRIDDADHLPVPILGQTTINAALTSMREWAWQKATALKNAGPQGSVQWNAVADEIQADTLAQVQAVLVATRDTPQGVATRDAYCTQHRFDGQ